jgi:hypothetical protein
VHRHDLFPPKQYPDSKFAALFQSRPSVIAEVTQKVKIPTPLLTTANHFYSLRNKLIHERATVGITDGEVELYRLAVQSILKILFKLKFPG